MSNYKNYVDDFPCRCGELLEQLTGPAASAGRDVTLLLMAASAGFITPYERLKKDGRFPHPFMDNTRYKERADKFTALLAGTVSASGLWPSQLDKWAYSGLGDTKGAPENWPELQTPAPLSADTPAGKIIDTLRHALAHAAVLSSADNKNQIVQLIFVAENRGNNGLVGEYRFVQVTPIAFRKFLAGWFALMKSWGMTQHEIGDRLAHREAELQSDAA